LADRGLPARATVEEGPHCSGSRGVKNRTWECEAGSWTSWWGLIPTEAACQGKQFYLVRTEMVWRLQEVGK
jgi:hypothetical protein